MTKKLKIGFLHIPRTGGAYLGGLLCSLVGQYFNFDGSSKHGDQENNRTPNIIELGYDYGKCENQLRNNPNFEKAKYFGGHFSTVIQDVFKEDYCTSFFTILRDPVIRTVSYIKRIVEDAHQLRNHIGNFEAAEFWDNFEKYIESENLNPKLLNGWEFSGFSNYMTKAIAGANISDPTLSVDKQMFEKAKDRLNSMYYVGYYESYATVVGEIYDRFKLNIPYSIIPYRNRYEEYLTNDVKEFIEKLNKFDIELFEYSHEKQDLTKDN